MIKSPNKISKLLIVSAILFSIAILHVGKIFAASEQVTGPAREWAGKASKAIDDGKYDEAILYANKALEINPDYAGAYNLRGLALYYKDEPELSKKAIKDFDMAIKLRPTGNAVYYQNRGNAKSDIGLYDGDIEDQNIALKLSPNNGTAYANRGSAYYKKKQYDLAIADYSRALEIDPNNFSAYRDRGNAYYRKNQYDLAIKDQSMALQLHPKDSKVYWYRARSYLKNGEPDLTIADCNRSLEINPNEVSAYLFRADAYRDKKEYDPAIKDYTRSLELRTKQEDKETSYFGRGIAYKAKGQVNEALGDLRKAVEINPKNKEYKEELTKLEAGAVGEALPEAPSGSAPSYAGSASSSGGESSSRPAVSAPTPAASEGGRVLTPFAGYAVADLCKESSSRQPGVPWRPDAPQSDAPISSAELGQYEAMLRHTMQGLRLFYGSLSAEEDKSFNAFWAPFFDHPTKAALEYFKQITPLLDEMAVTLNNLNGMLPEMGEAMQGVILVSGDPESSAARIAAAEYQGVKAHRAKLDDLAKRIEALGNPPNPLAAKCAARKRHRKALGGQDIWALLRQAEFVGLRTGSGRNRVAGNIVYIDEINKPTAELRWEGTKFTYNSKDAHFDDPSEPWSVGEKGQPQWGGFSYKFEGSGEMSKDGLSVISFHGVRTRRSFMPPQVVEEVKRFDYDSPALVLYQGKPVEAGDRIRLVYSNADAPDLTGKQVAEGSLVLEFRNVLDKEEIDWAGIVNTIGNQMKKAGGEAVSDSSAPSNRIVAGRPGAGGGQQGGTGPQASADPEKDPQVIKEAVDQHLALAAQARRDADRWAKDARAENDPERRKELEKRASEIYANAQTEQDIADSLRTGTMVHTRTEWDERQHQALVDSVKKEIAVFALENKLLANIPKVGDMVAGAEGVQLREQTQARISDAIKSPDRLQKLAAIYGDLQNKVINQGEQQMAAEQAKVEMWDNRVAIAENVQFAASTSFMLAGLWAPAEIGMLAIGYAGSTGFAEGGVKGAAIAVTRSVSAKADVVISAYEGAIRKDPNTGEPAGAWGAIEGALWSIGTNKAMGAMSNRLQKFKADSALARQGAGGAGFKSVARTKGAGRLKEYDFKTPEERYKAEFGSANTPQQKAAVEKKYAVQVEREKMHQEGETALKKAEDAIHRGGDPAKVKENYNKDLNSINEKYKDKTRNQEHEEVLKELGFDAKKDIKPTGSAPKTAASDMDFTPEGSTPHEAYQKGKAYTEAMKERGHSVDEYGDRWVDNTNDSTIWKPGFGADKPGSSSFEAEVIFGTLPHSDKFGTKGGIEWTSSPTHTTDDPLGAVLANAGKASAAGLGNSHPKDLHTIGKSAVKAAEAAGIEVEPQLKAQIEALKAHQTPEQAGVVELGADQATKDRQTKSFLDKVEALMGRAYNGAKAKSEQNAKALEQQADAAGNSGAAYNIRTKLGAYKAGNDAALTTIAQASPGLGKAMAPTLKASDIVPGASTGKTGDLNLGGLARELFGDRESAAQAPPPSANANDPAFAGLGKRCKEGVKRVQDKLTAVKPGSEQARYLAELKSALEHGEKNPAEAVRNIRGLSGQELAVVLAQLGVPTKPSETPGEKP